MLYFLYSLHLWDTLAHADAIYLNFRHLKRNLNCAYSVCCVNIYIIQLILTTHQCDFLSEANRFTNRVFLRIINDSFTFDTSLLQTLRCNVLVRLYYLLKRLLRSLPNCDTCKLSRIGRRLLNKKSPQILCQRRSFRSIYVRSEEAEQVHMKRKASLSSLLPYVCCMYVCCREEGLEFSRLFSSEAKVQ